MYEVYESFYKTVEKSAEFSKFCSTVYGIDLSQDGFSDIEQIEFLLEKLSLSPESRFLDIGCGNGKLLAYVYSKTGADVYGFDYSPTAVESAKNRLPDLKENFNVGDIDEISYEEQFFDAIVSVDTLYFTDDLNGFVNRIMSWLKPGGVFAAFYMDEGKTPCKTQLASILDKNGTKYEVFDFCDSHYYIMRKKHDTALLMREALERDGLKEHTERMLRESFDCSITKEGAGDEYCGCRFLYVVRK